MREPTRFELLGCGQYQPDWYAGMSAIAVVAACQWLTSTKYFNSFETRPRGNLTIANPIDEIGIDALWLLAAYAHDNGEHWALDRDGHTLTLASRTAQHVRFS